MNVNQNDLPSRQFDLELTTLSAFSLLEAKTKRDLLYVVLESVIADQETKDNLTNQDLHFLAVIQRVSVNHINTLVVKGACNHPVFIVDSGGQQRKTNSLQSIQEADVLMSTAPCSHNLHVPITLMDMATKYLDLKSESYVNREPEFDLPRAKDLDFYEAGDRVNWMLMHLKPEFRSELYLMGKDAEFLAKLVRFVNVTDHGLINKVLAVCPSCLRSSELKWDIDVSTFM